MNKRGSKLLSAVLAVSQKDKKLLKESLLKLEKSVKLSGFQPEFVLVANGTKLDKPGYLKSKLRIIPTLKNLGFGSAINLGMSKAVSDWVIISCPDVLTDRDCLKQIFKSAKIKNCALIGPRVVLTDGTLQPTILPYPSLWQIFIEQSLLYKLWPSVFKSPLSDKKKYRKISSVEAVAAIFWLINRKAFLKVSGFDQGFFLYFEDVDFCRRLISSGQKIYYNPLGRVRHLAHQSTGGETDGTLYSQSLRKFLRKYYQGPYVYICYLIFVAGCSIRIVYWIIRRIFVRDNLMRHKIIGKITFLNKAAFFR